MSKPIQLLLMVWDRPEYTRMTLENLVRVTKRPFQLTIYDNGSEPPTAKYLKRWVEDNPTLVRKFTRNPTNQGLVPPTQEFWGEMEKEGHPWWGKIDNDILHPEGWLSCLVEVLEKFPRVGVVSSCPVRDYGGTGIIKSPELVVESGDLGYYPVPFAGGCGYPMRKEACSSGGPLSSGSGIFSWTVYQDHLNKLGWLTVLAYPLVLVKHLGTWGKQSLDTPEYREYDRKIWEMRHGKGSECPYYEEEK